MRWWSERLAGKDWRAPAGGRERLPIVIAGAAMIVMAFFVVAVVLNRGESTGDGDLATGGPMDAATGRAGTRGLVVDTFAGDDGAPIETSETGQPWYAVSGEWTVRGGHASVTATADAPTAVIVVDPRQADGTFTVTFARVVPGAGMVFRYGGPRNFWYLTAAPQAATWRVLRVADGVQTEIDTLGVVPVADGTTIAVELRGAEIGFMVDGQHRKTITDGTLAGNSRVGLIASGYAADQARWANVVFSAAGTGPTALVPPPTGGGGFPELPRT